MIDSQLLELVRLRRELNEITKKQRPITCSSTLQLFAPVYAVEVAQNQLAKWMQEQDDAIEAVRKAETAIVIRHPQLSDYVFPLCCCENGAGIRDLLKPTLSSWLKHRRLGGLLTNSVVIKLIAPSSLFFTRSTNASLTGFFSNSDLWQHIARNYLSFIDVSTLSCVSHSLLSLCYNTPREASHTILLSCAEQDFHPTVALNQNK
jgi:hypothetical protein